MGDKRPISLAGGIPKNVCRYSALKEMELNTNYLSESWIQWRPSKQYGLEKRVGEKQWFYIGENKHCFCQVIKGTNSNHKSVSQWGAVDMTGWEWHFTTVFFLPTAHAPSLSMRKTSNSKRETSLRKPNQYSSKLSRSLKAWKCGTPSQKRSLKRHDNFNVLILVHIL